MQYDDEQRVVSSQKDALQGATTFTYDFVNGVTTVVDAMTNVSYYHYDTQLRVKEIEDNLGNKQFSNTTPTTTAYRSLIKTVIPRPTPTTPMAT
jgi:YD repeat-containing protein